MRNENQWNNSPEDANSNTPQPENNETNAWQTPPSDASDSQGSAAPLENSNFASENAWNQNSTSAPEGFGSNSAKDAQNEASNSWDNAPASSTDEPQWIQETTSAIPPIASANNQDAPTQYFASSSNTYPGQNAGGYATNSARHPDENYGPGANNFYSSSTGTNYESGTEKTGIKRWLWALIALLILLLVALAAAYGFNVWQNSSNDEATASDDDAVVATTSSEEAAASSVEESAEETESSTEADNETDTTSVVTITDTVTEEAAPVEFRVHPRGTDPSTLDPRLNSRGWVTAPNTYCTGNSTLVYAGTNGSDYVTICASGSNYTYRSLYRGGTLEQSAVRLSDSQYNIDAAPNQIQIRGNELLVRDSNGTIISSTSLDQRYMIEY